MRMTINFIRLMAALVVCFLIATSTAEAFLNTSIDLEEKVISVFSYGKVTVEPDGVNIFFRYASEPYPTTKEAFSDCNAKINQVISSIKSMDLAIESIEKTPISFFFQKKSQFRRPPGTFDPSIDKESQKDKEAVNCVAAQDIRIVLSGKAKDENKIFNDIMSIEDKMIENNMVPIEPNEFGRKKFTFLYYWYGEKNNVEWFVKDKAPVKKQGLEIAIDKARAEAEEIAKKLGKAIIGVHSVQYIDEKEKIIHIWNSFCPISVKETKEDYNKIQYQSGIIVNFSFE